MYGIELYLLEASGGFINCPQTCLPSDPCQCSGLRAGMDGNITITATSCGDLQGPPAVIYVMPQGKLYIYILHLHATKLSLVPRPLPVFQCCTHAEKH